MPNDSQRPSLVGSPPGSRFGIARTDGRTNVRSNGVTTDYQLKAVDAGARTAEIESIGEILAHGLGISSERHPKIREGERAEIPYWVRSAVWHRDRGKCELCSERVRGAWHLDHITPWSAGGSDSTTNLRVLCERHNLERSNFRDSTERPRRGATWWCLNCYSVKWERYGLPECPRHSISKWCRVVRGVQWALDNELDDWHAREAIDPDNSSLTIAYCAHCDAPGLTDVVL